jgi:hypothetical protein
MQFQKTPSQDPHMIQWLYIHPTSSPDAHAHAATAAASATGVASATTGVIETGTTWLFTIGPLGQGFPSASCILIIWFFGPGTAPARVSTCP